ncbi:MAG: hypothetical protein CL933_23325 [Deltaproteobacteria bacterium]|nr:hypothetical protein [Deltaproteobacteria bacterium]
MAGLIEAVFGPSSHRVRSFSLARKRGFPRQGKSLPPRSPLRILFSGERPGGSLRIDASIVSWVDRRIGVAGREPRDLLWH